jgi:hypothetical protein
LERAESTEVRVLMAFFLDCLRTELTLSSVDLLRSESELISMTCSEGGGASLTLGTLAGFCSRKSTIYQQETELALQDKRGNGAGTLLWLSPALS